MAPTPRARLSQLETIHLIFVVIVAYSNGLLVVLTSPFTGYSTTLVNHARIAFTRSISRWTTVRQMQYINPPISDQYHAYAELKGFNPEEITLPDGSKAYWLGSPKAQKILVWFHGGGYNLPIDPQHIPFLDSVHQANPSVSVLLLGYTLAPHGIYPTQLREGVLLLSHLHSVLHLPASAISIGGDSAGGNLALGVLSHLLHPHPDIPALDLGGQQLASCILVAPWATFDPEGWPSVQANARKDIVDLVMNDRWSTSFLGGAKRDGFNEPLSLPADDPWWQGLDRIVRDIVVICGADEILVDSIRELVKRLQKVHPKIDFLAAKNEWHDKPMVKSTGTDPGEQGAALKAFVAAKL